MAEKMQADQGVSQSVRPLLCAASLARTAGVGVWVQGRANSGRTEPLTPNTSPRSMRSISSGPRQRQKKVQRAMVLPPVYLQIEHCISKEVWCAVYVLWQHGGIHGLNLVWSEHPISSRPRADVDFQVMKSNLLSQIKKSPGAQFSVPAASSNQPANAASPTRVEITRNAYDFYLTQGASSVSMKLITEQASIAASVSREMHAEPYAPYAHGGLND
jgi:hypothetical protein